MCLVQSQNLNENLCPVPAYLNILFSAIRENVKMTIELNLMSRGYSEQFDELKFQHLQLAPLSTDKTSQRPELTQINLDTHTSKTELMKDDFEF